MLDFAIWANDLTLSLDLKGLEAKETGGGAIWSLMVLEIVIARLDIIAKPE